MWSFFMSKLIKIDIINTIFASRINKNEITQKSSIYGHRFAYGNF